MEIIKVTHSGGEYNIYAGENILKEALERFFDEHRYDRVFLVTDSNVDKLWKDSFLAELKDIGCQAEGVFVFKAGELNKRLSTVSGMYAEFSAAKLTRKSLVIALGGGVCGDMAGFAAATYLRGIDVLQVPTTLLSQIDSSIGGKTGVDLDIGKNLVGAFHQPAAVIADSKFLDTLPERYINDGMGEAVKYGCIADETLFHGIASRSIDCADMIARCMKIKADVVMDDEFEQGRRAILNYGHTIGHAVEKLGGFEKYSHGESIGIGMLYAARIGAVMGFDGGLEDKIRNALIAWNMPTETDHPKDKLIEIASSDKKRTADDLKFIFVDRPGNAVIKEIPLSLLAKCL